MPSALRLLTATGAAVALALSATSPAASQPVPVASAAAAPRLAAPKPLAGKVVVVDPGHQLGNSSHRAKIARKVDAGGLRKACNTVGTATRSGYRESAFTMSVANHLKQRLVAQGARVYLTRTRESTKLWGPCVDARGRLAGKVHADALVSIQADGTPSRYHGFFVIRPAYRRGITDDIYRSSRTLSADVRAGLDRAGALRANYYGGDGFDTRDDMGTLNLSSAPAVMVELGNMKNAGDSGQMRSDRSRDGLYAAGLAGGVTNYLTR